MITLRLGQRASIALQVLALAAFLFAGTAGIPAHDDHGLLDSDHPCVICHLASAPADLPAFGAATAVIRGPDDTTPAIPPPLFLRRGQEPAHSSHPLRGPPSL
jgi:hypothetical protein